MNEIINNRDLMRTRSVETCRGCASPQIHTRDYGRATIACMTYLRKQNQQLVADRDKWRDRCERLIGHYGDKTTWICPFDSCTELPCKHAETLFLEDAVDAHGYSFAAQIQKEIDNDTTR